MRLHHFFLAVLLLGSDLYAEENTDLNIFSGKLGMHNGAAGEDSVCDDVFTIRKTAEEGHIIANGPVLPIVPGVVSAENALVCTSGTNTVWS